MAATAAKAEISLAKTCKKLGITEEGKRWLDLCLDPFKDMNMPTAGLPDTIELPSVVETIHDTVNISVPSSAGAGLWDCNIFLDQLYSAVDVYSTNAFNSEHILARVGQTLTGTRGGVQIRSGPAGTALSQNFSAAPLNLKPDVFAGADIRLIGIGLEVHNTTAEINKQGSVVAWRSPEADEEPALVTLINDNTGTTPCVSTTVLSCFLADPPATAGEAIDLPGSLQWEAKDGVYIVPVMTQPTVLPDSHRPFMPVGSDTTTALIYTPQILAGGVANVQYSTARNLKLPFGMAGCFFTGLSNSTTLQLNLTYYVEVFPNKLNVLRRIAQPSPPNDAMALQLYGKIQESLPVACQVSDNFIGAFIAGVARVASTVVRALPAVGRALGAGSQLISALNGDGFMNHNEVNRVIAQPSQQSALVISQPTRRIVQAPEIVYPQATNNKQIVVYQKPPQRQEVLYVQESVSQNTGVTQQATRKAKKRKRKAINTAIDQAIESGIRDGNRWIENKK